MKIIQSGSFKRIYKRLQSNQRYSVNEAIEFILKDPAIGTQTIGDLKGYSVYKFSCNNQQYLLSYQYSSEELVLLYLGSHENFYRDLKRTS
ncbi:MAG: hypothetical protein LEGION0398_MBIBDBAK_01008 [Legionellaceae bacterium]